MNRAERRRWAREGRRRRKDWLRAVLDSSNLSDDEKRVARIVAEVADDDGHFFTIEEDDGGLTISATKDGPGITIPPEQARAS